jgi:hypothetical protein
MNSNFPLEITLGELTKLQKCGMKVGYAGLINYPDSMVFKLVKLPISSFKLRYDLNQLKNSSDPIDIEDMDVIYHLKTLLENNTTLTPIVVLKRGDSYDVLDGKHRLTAYNELGYETIDAYLI